MEKVSKRIFDEIGYDVSGFVKEQVMSLDGRPATSSGTDDTKVLELEKKLEEAERKISELARKLKDAERKTKRPEVRGKAADTGEDAPKDL